MLREEDLILLVEIVSILIIVLAALTISLVYIEKNRKLRYGQELLRTRLEMQEQSLDKIYHEIHDNIGQALSLAKLHLYAVEPELPEELNKKVRSSKELVSKAITDLRNLSRDRAPKEVGELNLTEAIKSQLSALAYSKKIKTYFNVTGENYVQDTKEQFLILHILNAILNRVAMNEDLVAMNIEVEYKPAHVTIFLSALPNKSIDNSLFVESTGFVIQGRRFNKRAVASAFAQMNPNMIS